MITTTLVEKTKEKLNIIYTVIINIILLIIYNTLSCYILNLVNIPITLFSLSILNLLTGIICLIVILKNKKIQKYYIKIKDIVITIIFLVITIGTAFINFQGTDRIKYISMDERIHYIAARQFSENTTLSNKWENSPVSRQFMPISYVNTGIIFKTISPFVTQVNMYHFYIGFEILIYFLSGMMFYLIINKIANTKLKTIIALIFSIFYIIGYPFNAMISGFEYLCVGILITTTIIYFMQEIYIRKDIKNIYKIIIMFLLNFGLIFSYCLFCPFVYLAELVYMIIISKKQYKGMIIPIILTLVLPGIIGVTYLLLPQLIANNGNTGISLEGWTYKNYWSNFILFIPFTIYLIYSDIKNKNKESIFIYCMSVFLIIYIGILFVGMKLNMCSSYYLYKNYNILWIVLIILHIKGMIKLTSTYLNKPQKKNVYPNSYIITLVLLVCYTLIYIVTFLYSILYLPVSVQRNLKREESIKDIMEIFSYNYTIATHKSSYLSKEQIEIIEYFNENIRKDYNNTLFIIRNSQMVWIYSLTGYKTLKDFEDLEEYSMHIQKCMNGEYEYLAYFYNEGNDEFIKNMLKNLENITVYENAAGKIVKIEGK